MASVVFSVFRDRELEMDVCSYQAIDILVEEKFTLWYNLGLVFQIT